MLQAEEEKALKRIDETRSKAQQMIENKKQQEQLEKDRQDQKELALKKAKDMVQGILEDKRRLPQVKQDQFERNFEIAREVKDESKKMVKQIRKMDKSYVRKAKERREEQKDMSDIIRMRNELIKINKLDVFKKEKDDQLIKEGKFILKKDKETRKLELLEAEVLKRLRDTHVKQQMAIEEI